MSTSSGHSLYTEKCLQTKIKSKKEKRMIVKQNLLSLESENANNLLFISIRL